MNFRAVFIAIIIATGLIVSAYLVNSQRPRTVVDQPNAEYVKASGKCAEHHRNARNAQHKQGEAAFWADLGINAPQACVRLYAQRDDLVAMRAVVFVIIAERSKR